MPRGISSFFMHPVRNLSRRYVPQRSRIRPRPRRRGCLSRRTGCTTYPDTSGTSNLRLLNLSGEVRNVEFEVTQRIRRDSGPRRTGYPTYPTGFGTSTDRLFNVSGPIFNPSNAIVYPVGKKNPQGHRIRCALRKRDIKKRVYLPFVFKRMPRRWRSVAPCISVEVSPSHPHSCRIAQ